MKPRVLIVSHTYTAAINRAKLDALARPVSLSAIIPARWQDALFTLDSNSIRGASRDYALHALPIRFDGHILRYLYPWRAFARVLRDTRPELVCVEEEPASLVLAQVAWLKRRYKLVFFSWENILHPTGFPPLERWNLSRGDGAIAGNRDAAQILRQKNFSKPIVVIPQLGVDPEIFSPARSKAARDRFVLGYVGRLAEEKGLWTLVRAVECLPDVTLVIVGAGPLRDALARWTGSRNLTERIQIQAAVPHQDVPRVLNEFDALVLPSQTTPRWKEQFGHILIEAMACAIPVIGSTSGAIPEVIADAGIIFPEGDRDALRDVIAGLQNDSARRTQVAEAGRTRVLEHYTHSHIAAQNVEFFKRILSP